MMAELKTEIRYDSDAVDFMDQKSEEFYTIWLNHAIQHALSERREVVLTEDAIATFTDAMSEFRKSGEE